MLFGLIVAFFSLFFDQLSKFWIDAHMLAERSSLVMCEYFSLIKVWNKGVSFSMFNEYGNWGSIVLCIIALIISAALLYWMYHEENKLKIFGLGLIVGGALGNVVDRLHFGAVMDFLDFHYKNYHWPAFNLADTFICIGACLLIVMEISEGKKKGLNDAKNNKF